MVLLDYGCILLLASDQDCQEKVEMHIFFDFIYLLWWLLHFWKWCVVQLMIKMNEKNVGH